MTIKMICRLGLPAGDRALPVEAWSGTYEEVECSCPYCKTAWCSRLRVCTGPGVAERSLQADLQNSMATIRPWLIAAVAVLQLVTKSQSACDPSCVTACTLTLSCDGGCRAGYGIDNQTHTCQPCDPNCLANASCNVRGPGKCDGPCRKGFGLTSTFTCAPCPFGCSSCLNGSEICDVCKPRFGLTRDQKCGACDVNCDLSLSSCNVSGAGYCDDRCRSGFALNSNHTCAPCAIGCSNCTVNGPGRCDSCSPGFGLTVVDRKCAPCDPNCDPAQACDVYGAGKCDVQCRGGYGFNETFGCAQCPVGCASCNTYATGKCEQCLDGYGLTVDRACVACPEGCAVCNSPWTGKCDRCAAGYGMNADRTCGACDPSCHPSSGCAAYGAGKCDTLCREKFRLVADHTCAACPAGCAVCNSTSTGKCDRCAAGYGMDADRICGACGAHCSPASNCDVYGPGKCDSVCVTDYYLQDDHTCKADLSDGYRGSTIALGIIAGMAVVAMAVVMGLLWRTHNAKSEHGDSSHNGWAGSAGAKKTPQATSPKASKPARQPQTKKHVDEEADEQDVYEEFDTDGKARRRYDNAAAVP